jgi:predicted RNA binding protein YcfA (HicA-like mRNA interferase family)
LFKLRSSAKLSGGASVGKNSRDIIRDLTADGGVHVATAGSHRHFKHPTKSGKVTVPHPKRDLHPKTVRSISPQAQQLGNR